MLRNTNDPWIPMAFHPQSVAVGQTPVHYSADTATACARLALGDAESEMNRVLLWLETEQHAYWSGQVRKRTEAVAKAKEAVRFKKVFKDSSGRTPSAVITAEFHWSA